jgi:hypothetical protein
MTVRKPLTTLNYVTRQCAAYYADGLDEEQRRAIIQNIWRACNFTLIDHRKKRKKPGRPRKAKKPDGRLRVMDLGAGEIAPLNFLDGTANDRDPS